MSGDVRPAPVCVDGAGRQQTALSLAVEQLILEFAVSFDGRVRYMEHVIATNSTGESDLETLATLAIDAVRAMDRKFDEDDEVTEGGR